MKGLFKLDDYNKGTVNHLELRGFLFLVRILVFGFKHLFFFFSVNIPELWIQYSHYSVISFLPRLYATLVQCLSREALEVL